MDSTPSSGGRDTEAPARGRLITLEGIDGAGKSTCVDVVRRHLTGRGLDVLVTREPGGTPFAESVREVLLATADAEAVDPLAETLLLFAARAQHVQRVIGPALATAKWVLSDRFIDATRAYQGGGRGVDDTTVTTLSRLAHPDIEPDLTLCLDLPVSQARRRIEQGAGARARTLDRFEQERTAFHERVRARYLELARSEPQRVRLVDAEQPRKSSHRASAPNSTTSCDRNNNNVLAAQGLPCEARHRPLEHRE